MVLNSSAQKAILFHLLPAHCGKLLILKGARKRNSECSCGMHKEKRSKARILCGLDVNPPDVDAPAGDI